MSFLVAIDGPAGSGKGTIAQIIADKLNFIKIDTGAMYRCVALYLLENNIEINNIQKIISKLDEINIKIDESKELVYLNNENVTDKIRQPNVSKIVSQVSSIKEVRLKLIDLQRKIASDKKVVMEGRDITTVVFPNANVKIYLDATLEVRAERRYLEVLEKNKDIKYEDVLNNIIIRDKNDKEKEFGALKVADDAIVIDTTYLNIEEVADKIINIIKMKMKG